LSAENVVALPKRYRYADALIAPGTYSARVLDFETRLYFRSSPRVVVWWLIVELGDAFESVIPGFYRVPALIGDARRHGRFKRVGLRSRLARDLAAMLQSRPPLDYFPLNVVTSKLYTVSVVTVERDAEQQAIPKGAQYSRVDRVLEQGV
jgi:hypothetical protein